MGIFANARGCNVGADITCAGVFNAGLDAGLNAGLKGRFKCRLNAG